MARQIKEDRIAINKPFNCLICSLIIKTKPILSRHQTRERGGLCLVDSPSSLMSPAMDERRKGAGRRERRGGVLKGERSSICQGKGRFVAPFSSPPPPPSCCGRPARGSLDDYPDVRPIVQAVPAPICRSITVPTTPCHQALRWFLLIALCGI